MAQKKKEVSNSRKALAPVVILMINPSPEKTKKNVQKNKTKPISAAKPIVKKGKTK